MPWFQRPLSLSLRLTLLFSVSAAVVFSTFGWVFSQSMKDHFVTQDTDELKVIVESVQNVLAGVQGEYDLPNLKQRFDDILVGHHDASLFITVDDGLNLYTSSEPDISSITKAYSQWDEDIQVHQWRYNNTPYTVLIERYDGAGTGGDGPFRIIAAVPFDEHLRFLSAFHRNLWFMIIGSVIVMGIMGWIAVRQGHAPLHEIISRIRRISTDELNLRLPPDKVPYELVDLVNSFNEMLQRMDTAFHRLSDFNADIAHELRTPITNLMTQTQVALSRARSTDEYREILYSNVEEYERLAQMVNDMLFLAQTDNRSRLDTTTVNLGNEVDELFDYYGGWAEECGIALERESSAAVSGDRAMLRRALGNLLSNAIRHTPAGGVVRVIINTEGARVTLCVENPGPTIPPEHLPKLFDRFYRIDSSRQRGDEGAGLGLAIVKSIVTAHGGKVDVISATGCTRFRISLPAGSGAVG